MPVNPFLILSSGRKITPPPPSPFISYPFVFILLVILVLFVDCRFSKDFSLSVCLDQNLFSVLFIFVPSLLYFSFDLSIYFFLSIYPSTSMFLVPSHTHFFFLSSTYRYDLFLFLLFSASPFQLPLPSILNSSKPAIHSHLSDINCN